ncbi:ATP-grasp domain-containing protein [Aeoliella sp.]|uniref:ATP-grasp domain-containing protein n=1 Tax=Aeoliella sp. TaxID=2795800 RepID=UPI003CCB8BC8
MDDKREPPELDSSEVAIYAETDIALRVAAKLQLALIEPSFDLLTQLPLDLTKRRIEYTTLSDARNRTDRFFVKPADCTDKVFDAGVCETGHAMRCPSRATDNTPVLVSEPVLWDIEYRTIVLHRKVIAMSPYIRGGWLAPNEDDEWPTSVDEVSSVKEVCDALLRDTSLELPPAFTLDVGRIEDRGWAVVEFNPVWCSGLLGCDLARVLPAIDGACFRKGHVPDEYSKWVITRE